MSFFGFGKKSAAAATNRKSAAPPRSKKSASPAMEAPQYHMSKSMHGAPPSYDLHLEDEAGVSDDGPGASVRRSKVASSRTKESTLGKLGKMASGAQTKGGGGDGGGGGGAAASAAHMRRAGAGTASVTRESRYAHMSNPNQAMAYNKVGPAEEAPPGPIHFKQDSFATKEARKSNRVTKPIGTTKTKRKKARDPSPIEDEAKREPSSRATKDKKGKSKKMAKKKAASKSSSISSKSARDSKYADDEDYDYFSDHSGGGRSGGDVKGLDHELEAEVRAPDVGGERAKADVDSAGIATRLQAITTDGAKSAAEHRAALKIQRLWLRAAASSRLREVMDRPPKGAFGAEQEVQQAKLSEDDDDRYDGEEEAVADNDETLSEGLALSASVGASKESAITSESKSAGSMYATPKDLGASGATTPTRGGGGASSGELAPEVVEFLDSFRLRHLEPQLVGLGVEKLPELQDVEADDLTELGVKVLDARRFIRGVGTLGLGADDPGPSAEDVDHAAASAGVPTVRHDELQMLNQVGGGSFGVVFKAKWRGAPVAVKVLRNSLTGDAMRGAEKEITKELTMMKRVGNHRNVVSLLGLSHMKFPARVAIVTDLMEKGSLHDVLVGKSGSIPDMPELLTMAAEAAAGVSHLHAEGCIHRDLACRNVLVDAHNHCRVGDFGFARFLDSEGDSVGVTASRIGPVRWMAPESLSKREYSAKSDVWAFGVTLFEIVTLGGSPWGDLSLAVIGGRVLSGETLEPDLPADCDPTLRGIMHACWQFRPEDRPTMAVVQTQLEALAARMTTGVGSVLPEPEFLVGSSRTGGASERKLAEADAAIGKPSPMPQPQPQQLAQAPQAPDYLPFPGLGDPAAAANAANAMRAPPAPTDDYPSFPGVAPRAPASSVAAQVQTKAGVPMEARAPATTPLEAYGVRGSGRQHTVTPVAQSTGYGVMPGAAPETAQRNAYELPAYMGGVAPADRGLEELLGGGAAGAAMSKPRAAVPADVAARNYNGVRPVRPGGITSRPRVEDRERALPPGYEPVPGPAPMRLRVDRSVSPTPRRVDASPPPPAHSYQHFSPGGRGAAMAEQAARVEAQTRSPAKAQKLVLKKSKGKSRR